MVPRKIYPCTFAPGLANRRVLGGGRKVTMSVYIHANVAAVQGHEGCGQIVRIGSGLSKSDCGFKVVSSSTSLYTNFCYP